MSQILNLKKFEFARLKIIFYFLSIWTCNKLVYDTSSGKINIFMKGVYSFKIYEGNFILRVFKS